MRPWRKDAGPRLSYAEHMFGTIVSLCGRRSLADGFIDRVGGRPSAHSVPGRLQQQRKHDYAALEVVACG